MEIVYTIQDLRHWLSAARRARRTIALAPTMGALHAGHLSLAALGREQADAVVMTIFVNPIQFNNAQDLSAYPRPVASDIQAAQAAGVDCLFIPDLQEIYPRSADTGSDRPSTCRIRAGDISWPLEGEHRPGHFDGVVTVVSILFHLVQPDVAVFGEKDYQQVQVVRQLVQDLHFPTTIVPAPTVRETDGLAMSSRNLLLTPDNRQKAPVIYHSLMAAQARVRAGEIQTNALIAGTQAMIQAAGLAVEYVAIVDPRRLCPLETVDADAQMLIAARAGAVRLIDNLRLVRPPTPRA